MVEMEDQDAAREAIHYALNSDEYTVLEFDRMDNDTITINDITEHVRQLERLQNGSDPAEPLDE